jgi:alpha-1,3-mannosyl-glycoprotein beta-1,2-N-acetylglucosaminyltransferase
LTTPTLLLKNPDQSEIINDKKGSTIPSHLRGYYKISRHYKWALDKVFTTFGFDSVIITEDDLNIADDFFEYFDSMQKILEMDSTLFCVSAWNDNGKRNLIDMSKNGKYKF